MPQVTKILLDYGADFSSIDKEHGGAPLDYLLHSDFQEVLFDFHFEAAQILVRHAEKIEQKERLPRGSLVLNQLGWDKQTPLRSLCPSRIFEFDQLFIDTLELFLELGAVYSKDFSPEALYIDPEECASPENFASVAPDFFIYAESYTSSENFLPCVLLLIRHFCNQNGNGTQKLELTGQNFKDLFCKIDQILGPGPFPAPPQGYDAYNPEPVRPYAEELKQLLQVHLPPYFILQIKNSISPQILINHIDACDSCKINNPISTVLPYLPIVYAVALRNADALQKIIDKEGEVNFKAHLPVFVGDKCIAKLPFKDVFAHLSNARADEDAKFWKILNQHSIE